MKNPLKDFSPAAYVFMVTFVVVLVAVFARYKSAGDFDPRVTFDDAASADEGGRRGGEAPATVKASSLGQNDISVRYADRLRDASALALGLTIYAVRERVSEKKRVIPSVGELMAEFGKTDLMPPGLTALEADRPIGFGMLGSRRGVYYVRYQPVPLAVEVLACGARGLDDGAVFMIRLPEAAPLPQPSAGPQTVAGGFATLYVAPFANAPIPVAFSSPQAYAAAGWRQEPLRAIPFPPEKIAALQTWLAAYEAQH